jgi:hypothetical protein
VASESVSERLARRCLPGLDARCVTALLPDRLMVSVTERRGRDPASLTDRRLADGLLLAGSSNCERAGLVASGTMSVLSKHSRAAGMFAPDVFIEALRASMGLAWRDSSGVGGPESERRERGLGGDGRKYWVGPNVMAGLIVCATNSPSLSIPALPRDRRGGRAECSLPGESGPGDLSVARSLCGIVAGEGFVGLLVRLTPAPSRSCCRLPHERPHN